MAGSGAAKHSVQRRTDMLSGTAGQASACFPLRESNAT